MTKKYSLNRADLIKIFTGAGIAAGGALLTYFSEVITQIDFGTWTPVVMAVWSVAVNAIRKFLQG